MRITSLIPIIILAGNGILLAAERGSTVAVSEIVEAPCSIKDAAYRDDDVAVLDPDNNYIWYIRADGGINQWEPVESRPEAIVYIGKWNYCISVWDRLSTSVRFYKYSEHQNSWQERSELSIDMTALEYTPIVLADPGADLTDRSDDLLGAVCYSNAESNPGAGPSGYSISLEPVLSEMREEHNQRILVHEETRFDGGAEGLDEKITLSLYRPSIACCTDGDETLVFVGWPGSGYYDNLQMYVVDTEEGLVEPGIVIVPTHLDRSSAASRSQEELTAEKEYVESLPAVMAEDGYAWEPSEERVCVHSVGVYDEMLWVVRTNGEHPVFDVYDIYEDDGCCNYFDTFEFDEESAIPNVADRWEFRITDEGILAFDQENVYILEVND